MLYARTGPEPLHRREHDAGQEAGSPANTLAASRLRRLEERSPAATETPRRPARSTSTARPARPWGGLREITGERPLRRRRRGGRPRTPRPRPVTGLGGGRAARHVPRREPHDQPRRAPPPAAPARPWQATAKPVRAARGPRAIVPVRPLGRVQRQQPHAGPEAQDADVDHHRAAPEADGFGGVERVAGAWSEAAPPGRATRGRGLRERGGTRPPSGTRKSPVQRSSTRRPGFTRAGHADDVDRSRAGSRHRPARVAPPRPGDPPGRGGA